MRVRFIEEGDDERLEVIKKLLPKETIICKNLEPEIENRLFDIIAKCIREELEIYRAYPKRKPKSEIIETKEEMVKSFNPTNNKTCFMGKGFKANDQLEDVELTYYRKHIGTIIHPVWGNCTLLEIWGGDHFEDHNEMVVGAFKYGMNMTHDCPEIKVHVNPLFQNCKSKKFHLSEEQQQYKDDMDMLLAKALVFGVKTPVESRRARKRT